MLARFFVRTVLKLVGTVLIVGFLVFAAIEMSIPGGFTTVVFGGPPGNSPRDLETIEFFHLDERMVVRYGHWVSDVSQGEFGISLRGGDPVSELILHKLPISLELMLAGLVLAVVLAIPLGLFAAANAERASGQVASAALGFMQSLPAFLVGTFFIWYFSVRLQWLPAASWVRLSDSVSGNLRNLLMPALALALPEIGSIGRVVNIDAARVLRTDYVTAAQAKGLPRWVLLFRHVLRPSSLGLLNVIGLNVGALLSGAIVIEQVFAIGGLGRAFIEAATDRDLYLVLGLTSYAAVVYVLVNSVVDLLVLLADPRIRSS